MFTVKFLQKKKEIAQILMCKYVIVQLLFQPYAINLHSASIKSTTFNSHHIKKMRVRAVMIEFLFFM